MSVESLKGTIRGLNELDQAIQSFLLDINFDIKSCVLGLDFCCYPEDNEIVYSLFVTEKCSNTFMDRVRNKYPDIDADEFLWSLLHEVGHLVTYDDVFDWDMITRIKDLPNLSDEVYYELTDEYLATEWAANYMREHRELVEEHWEHIRAAIVNIYELNGVDYNER